MLDAGASAGDKSHSTPVLREETSGAKRAPDKRNGRFAGHFRRKERPRAGESGVGSNAGPICFGGCNILSRKVGSLPASSTQVIGSLKIYVTLSARRSYGSIDPKLRQRCDTMSPISLSQQPLASYLALL